MGVAIGIALSHQALASIIGATRESVTMILGDLQAEGLLQVMRKRLLVQDIRRLAGIVQLNAPSIGNVSRFESNSEQFRKGRQIKPDQEENLHDSVGL